MNVNSPRNKSWRDRLMDVVTVVVAVAALAAAGDRFLRPPADASAEASAVESKLVGHVPGAVQLIADGTRDRRSVSFAAARPQLVMLFRTTCPACQATKPVWEEISASLQPGQQAHAITAEPAGGGQTFFASPRVQVWHAADPGEQARAYPSPYVPTTMVVGADGRILYARIGVLRPDDAETIGRLLRG